MLVIRKAQIEEIERVTSYYHNVIDAMEGSLYNPCWKRDIYPSDDYIKQAINNQTLFIGLSQKRVPKGVFLGKETKACENKPDHIACGMILDNNSNEGYAKVKWQKDIAKDKVTVVHIFGVHPYFTGRGYAKQMLATAQQYAREQGQQAVRLDVLSGSVPAKKLYEKMGFVCIDTIDMYYDDTGWTKFDLYEYLL